MYETIRFNREVQVVKRDKRGTKIICVIPTYYQNDLEIGNLISKLLGDNDKMYKLALEI